jgi:hypothetical protein
MAVPWRRGEENCAARGSEKELLPVTFDLHTVVLLNIEPHCSDVCVGEVPENHLVIVDAFPTNARPK